MCVMPLLKMNLEESRVRIPLMMDGSWFSGEIENLREDTSVETERKRKRSEGRRLRRLKFLREMKRLKSIKPLQISDINSSEIDMEQEVITLDQTDRRDSPPTLRVRRTKDLISRCLGAPNSSIVLISSDSDDSQTPWKQCSSELDARLAEKPEIHFRIQSNQELVEHVRWKPLCDDSNVSHCSNAPSSPTAPTGETSHSGGSSRLERSNVEKTGIPFRIRTTAELIGDTARTPVEFVGGVTLVLPSSSKLLPSPSITGVLPSSSKPLLSGSITDRAGSPAEHFYSVHSSDCPKTDENLAHSMTQPGENFFSKLDQCRVGKGIPFRIRSTTELMSTPSVVKPRIVPNPVGQSQETQQSVGNPSMPFRIHSTMELMSTTVGGFVCDDPNWLNSPPVKSSESSSYSRDDSCERQPTAKGSKVPSPLHTEATIEAVATGSKFSKKKVPPDSGQPAFYSPAKMDIKGRRFESASSCSAFSKTVFPGDPAIMQSFPKPPSYSSMPYEMFPPPPSYFYSESPMPTAWSARCLPSRKPEMMQQYPKPIPLDHQATGFDVTSIAAALLGLESLPQVRSAKRKHGRSQKEREIIDQLNQVTAVLREFKLMKKILNEKPDHALKLASEHYINVSPIVDKDALGRHKCQLVCIQKKLVEQLKAERSRAGNIKEKRLEKLNSRRSQRTQQSGQESSVINVNLDGEVRGVQIPPVRAPKALGESSVVYTNLDGELEQGRIAPLPGAKAPGESSVVYVNLDGELEDDGIPPLPGSKARGKSSVVYTNLDGELEQGRIAPLPGAKAPGESSVVYVNLDGELEDDGIPPLLGKKAPGESSVVYVNLDGILADEPTPPRPAPIAQPEDRNRLVIGSRSGECRVPSPMSVDDLDNGLAPDAPAGSPLFAKTGSGSWSEFDAPKTISMAPISSIKYPTSDMKICLGDSKVSDQVLSLGGKVERQEPDSLPLVRPAKRTHGRSQKGVPRGASPTDPPKPSASAASSDSSKTDDFKTINSDRNVAPPKLPWTALSDTSWDALYR